MGVYAMNFISLVRLNAPKCKILQCVAVKGGNACDQEVAFIVWVMEQLGFKANAPGEWIEEVRRFVWSWQLPRADGSTYNVILHQYPDVESTSAIVRAFTPEQQLAASPNLFRVAVMSCPVEGTHGENV